MELKSARQRGNYKNEKRIFAASAPSRNQTVRPLPPIGKAVQVGIVLCRITALHREIERVTCLLTSFMT